MYQYIAYFIWTYIEGEDGQGRKACLALLKSIQKISEIEPIYIRVEETKVKVYQWNLSKKFVFPLFVLNGLYYFFSKIEFRLFY